mmetsp:Transcript_25057/g.99647  ORF Transcript_25057/g.99647 Transcript_25057/m.99647 type:complete len:272 (-) Transcript_25057:259-1074(-)
MGPTPHPIRRLIQCQSQSAKSPSAMPRAEFTMDRPQLPATTVRALCRRPSAAPWPPRHHGARVLVESSRRRCGLVRRGGGGSPRPHPRGRRGTTRAAPPRARSRPLRGRAAARCASSSTNASTAATNRATVLPSPSLLLVAASSSSVNIPEEEDDEGPTTRDASVGGAAGAASARTAVCRAWTRSGARTCLGRSGASRGLGPRLAHPTGDVVAPPPPGPPPCKRASGHRSAAAPATAPTTAPLRCWRPGGYLSRRSPSRASRAGRAGRSHQ